MSTNLSKNIRRALTPSSVSQIAWWRSLRTILTVPFLIILLATAGLIIYIKALTWFQGGE